MAPPNKTTRTGVLGFLLHRLEEAEDVGLGVTRISYSQIQDAGRRWMMDHGWDSYSPNNIGRRLREIVSDDPKYSPRLRDYGLSVREVPHTNNEKAWLLFRTKADVTSGPSDPSAPPPPSKPGTDLWPDPQANPQADPPQADPPTTRPRGHDPFSLLNPRSS